MDTEISTPIEYSPQVDNDVYREEPEQPQYYYTPPPPIPAPPTQQPESNRDFIASLDKTAYIVIFAAFILGFFMGKTMQPVILRHG